MRVNYNICRGGTAWRILSCVSVCFLLCVLTTVLSGCSHNRDGDRTLIADTDFEPDNPPDAGDPTVHDDKDEPVSLFGNKPGTVIPYEKVTKISADPTGRQVLDDYDGDGIPNDEETATNPFVSDTPRLVTRIAPPITMEIRVSSTSSSENHTETVEDSGIAETISRSMEDRQYTSLNSKTTPYMSKESQSFSDSNSNSWGSDDETSVGGSVSCGGVWGHGSTSFNYSSKHARNESWSSAISKSTSSEKMAFVDADYVDNLSKNGTAFTDDTVEKITKNSRKSEVLKKTDIIGPEAGIVRASFFIKNETINIPAHISNVKCTLTFKTPAGKFLPVKTFLLRNEDYTQFEQDVYGNEELGPYTVAIECLNTQEVTRALQRGYTPQIHVVSFDIVKVKDSNYNPGVDNLKIVEESAKGRTALVKISGTDMRETYRVCAFDVDEKGNVTVGISLKKALYNIFSSKTGNGERFDRDNNRSPLTITDSGLKWKKGAVDDSEYTYGANIIGNSWRLFETYVKSYDDGNDVTRRIETIKRIGPLIKYNPFDKEDNPGYDPNELLSENEIRKMKYWYVYHNGKYYEGDINDPIWPGDRFEIICVDVNDFNDHFTSFNYTPMQSESGVTIGTRWNTLSNDGEFARAKYLGKLYQEDKVVLEIDLKETRFLADPKAVQQSLTQWNSSNPDLGYKIGVDTDQKSGKPSEFSFVAYPGVNSISIDIGDSDNANSYEITLYQHNPSAAKYEQAAVYDITASDLVRNGNVFNIHRGTSPRIGSASAQFITQGLTAGNYKVYIKSWGKLYGVNVSCSSSGNGQIINVPDAENRIPNNYSSIVTGMTKSISVWIGSGANTEMFEVRVTGPLNCGEGGTASTKTYYASAGYNVFDIQTPDASAMFSAKIASGEPGVYNVEVYPLNRFYTTSASVSSTYHDKVQVTTVFFDKYENQKSLRAKVWDPLSMIEALNLEVNFNDSPLWYPDDGNAWYKLRFSNYDTRDGKYIDCSSTYYIDYKKQKFYISFAPPAGTGFSFWNVFSGGRDAVDLYIRTSAIPKYRDRFWPRPDRSVSVLFSRAGDFISSWFDGVMDNLTDATGIESVLEDHSGSGKLLGSGNIEDYFFSPYEYRKIGIVARLSGDQLVLADQERVDCAIFDAPIVSGDRTIIVPNIRSSYCSKYEVYYKQISGNADSLLNENVALWPKVVTDVVGNGNSCAINNLEPNKRYAVAVIGYKVLVDGIEKTKGPTFYNTSDNHIVALVPRTTNKPAAPSSFVAGLKDGENTIVITNVISSGATHYRAYYREAGAVNWASTEVVGNETGAEKFEIPSLEAWTEYELIVAAINQYTPGNDDPVTISNMSFWATTSCITIPTRFEPVNTIRVEWYDLDYSGNKTGTKVLSEVDPSFTEWDSLRDNDITGGIRIRFNKTDLPQNATLYRLSYKMNFLRIGHNCESDYWTRIIREYSESDYQDIRNSNEYIVISPRRLYARNAYNVTDIEDNGYNGGLAPGFYSGSDRVYTYYMVQIDYTIDLINRKGEFIRYNKSIYLPNFYTTRERDPITDRKYWCGYGWESYYQY